MLEADIIKQVEMKEKIKTISQKNEKSTLNQTVEQKSHQKEKNQGCLSHVSYSGPFSKWTREELKQMDKSTRKLMTMNKTLHPRDYIDYMFQEKKKTQH